MSPRDAFQIIVDRTDLRDPEARRAFAVLNWTVTVAQLFLDATAPVRTRVRTVIPGAAHPADIAQHDQQRAKARTELDRAATKLRNLL